MSRDPAYGRGHPEPVFLPHWFPLISGQAIEGADAQVQLTIPDGCQIIEIRAEDDKVYWDFGAIAQPLSPGYIPADGAEIIGPIPISVLAARGVTVWVTIGATAHVMYFRETTGGHA